MLISKTTKIKWNPRIKKRYESKGYIFTKWKDEFEVNVEDLSKGSHSLIDIKCDGCNEKIEGVRWVDYKKQIEKENKYYCIKCVHNGCNKYISFYEWCYDNLSKEEADNIMLRWDYDLNVDKNGNKLSPKNIDFSSTGFNNKGYWFSCLKYPEHESEQRHITHFTSFQIKNINCKQCNTISITHSHLIDYLVNKEDAFKYSVGSGEKLLMKCPDCGHEKGIPIFRLIKQGFACPKCSDGISYPEKFVFNALEQLNESFILQLTKTTFKWCGNYRYDFYIPKINCIIETHGLQHYEEAMGDWTNLNEIQENDKQKEILAKQNNIKDDNYIVINCQKSELEWIKKSIINSKLPTLLNFKEEDINWLRCHEYACSSLVKVVCDLWNSGINYTSGIVKVSKFSESTVRKYLKQGVELGWCDYDSTKKIREKVTIIKIKKYKEKIKKNSFERKINLYDKNMKLIDTFESINLTANWLVENDICQTFNNARWAINKFSKENKIYKDYYFVKINRLN